MRDAVGPGVEIMIDVNMGWTADQAIHAGRRFEECDIYWLEEPVTADDFAGYLRCAEVLGHARGRRGDAFRACRSQAAAGESAHSHPAARPDARRADELRKIATVADTWGMTIAPHLFPELNAHLLAS